MSGSPRTVVVLCVEGCKQGLQVSWAVAPVKHEVLLKHLRKPQWWASDLVADLR